MGQEQLEDRIVECRIGNQDLRTIGEQKNRFFLIFREQKKVKEIKPLPKNHHNVFLKQFFEAMINFD